MMNKIWQFIIPVSIILLLFLYGIHQGNKSNHEDRVIPTTEAYFEDQSTSLSFDQIVSKQNVGEFSVSKNSYLTLGNSRSTWWIKLDGHFAKNDREDYMILINNPSIQYITAYIPAGNNKDYFIRKSGWGYKSADKTIGAYQMPAINLPQQFDKDRAIYLRIQSIYPLNYSIRILSESRFFAHQQQDLIFIGILLGTFLTMAVLNCVIYGVFQDKTYLYYAYYQIAMFAFQFVSMGVNNLLSAPISNILAMNQVLFSCLMFITSLIFVKAFLHTRQNAPKHQIALNILMIILSINILLMLFGRRYEANIITDYIGYLTGATTLSVAILCVRKKIDQAKFFLLAWSALIAGGIVFILRNSGVLPNCFLVQHFMLITATGEAILIFTALVDRARVLWEEKYHALQLYQEAEENRKNTEISFLRAQIQPHFLYNTLSVIAALTVKNPQRAKELLYQLAHYLRGSFHFENKDGMTTLAEELETIRAYLVIEKERFREKLEVEYEVDESVNLPIPLLIIQPLVENAIRHGIFKRPEGGRIKIVVERQLNYVMIQVQDNGIGIPEERLSRLLNQDNTAAGVGLWNINKRLTLLYGQGLVIESSETLGTSVTIRIPVEEGMKE